MATLSSVLAWRISGTGEPGGLPSMGSHRVRHDWSNLAVVAANVGNLLSSSSSFSKPSLDIWKFLVHIVLEPSTQDFCMTLLAWEMDAIVRLLAHSLVLPFLGIEMIDLFPFCGHCRVFQICWHNEYITLMASSFRDLNSSAGISLHPLALLTAVLLKAHLTSHTRMSGSGRQTTPL